MSLKPTYRALFLGAGPQMQCGVGHFTRLLQETIESAEPGSTTALTLTRGEGSLLVSLGRVLPQREWPEAGSKKNIR